MCLITQIYWHIIYHQRQPQCCNKISWSAFIQLRTSSFFIANTVKLCYLRHYFNKKKLANTTKANIIHSIAYPWLSFKKFTVRVRQILSKILSKCDTLCIMSSKFLCYRFSVSYCNGFELLDVLYHSLLRATNINAMEYYFCQDI